MRARFGRYLFCFKFDAKTENTNRILRVYSVARTVKSQISASSQNTFYRHVKIIIELDDPTQQRISFTFRCD